MASEKIKSLTISVIPGTGHIGGAIVKQLSIAGLKVILSSRDPAKAKAAAAKLSASVKHPVEGLSIVDAAAAADVVFWTPSGPRADREALLESLAKYLEGKIIIDCTNASYFFEENKWGQISSTLLNQEALGVPARWTNAFNHVFAEILADPPVNDPYSVFVAGDDEDAVSITAAIVDSIPGYKAVKAGPLKNTKITELLVPFMVALDQSNFGGKSVTGYRFA